MLIKRSCWLAAGLALFAIGTFVVTPGNVHTGVKPIGLIMLLVGMAIVGCIVIPWFELLTAWLREKTDSEQLRASISFPEYVTATTAIAVLMFLIAVLVAVLYFQGHWIHDWGPNLLVGALTVGFTVTVVERALRSDATRHNAARLARPKAHIRLAVRLFCAAVIADYASTHVQTYKDIPTDPSELFAFWIDEAGNEDTPRFVGAAGDPLVLAAAHGAAGQIRNAISRDVEVLDPNLIGAIDVFNIGIGLASMGTPVLVGLDPSTAQEMYRDSSRAAITAMQPLLPSAQAFTRDPIDMAGDVGRADQWRARASQLASETPNP